MRPLCLSVRGRWLAGDTQTRSWGRRRGPGRGTRYRAIPFPHRSCPPNSTCKITPSVKRFLLPRHALPLAHDDHLPPCVQKECVCVCVYIFIWPSMNNLPCPRFNKTVPCILLSRLSLDFFLFPVRPSSAQSLSPELALNREAEEKPEAGDPWLPASACTRTSCLRTKWNASRQPTPSPSTSPPKASNACTLLLGSFSSCR